MAIQNSLTSFKELLDIEPPFGAYLSGKYIKSFAYLTIKDRLPVIITKIIDNLSRTKESINKKHGGNSAEEVKQIIGDLSKLRSEMMTNKQLQPLELSNTNKDADAAIWNKRLEEQQVIDKSPQTWYNSCWLLSECYMYRRISQIFSLTNSLSSFDPFEAQKQANFTDSIGSIGFLAKHVMSLVNKNSSYSLDDQNKDLKQLLKLNLWGNRCDLSLSSGDKSNVDGNPVEGLSLFDDDLLIDNTQCVWNLLNSHKNTDVIVDIVLDNSGYELFTDLCLAVYLTSHRFTNKIRFYVKRIPWFVSDVTQQDFHWTIEFMNNSMNKDIKAFGEVCSNYLNSGKWSIEIESFWTEPFDYSEMKMQSPELYSKLSNAILVIFKGDLNYRKLLGDINWDHSTDLMTSLRGFNPTNLVTLRTLKADLVVGLDNDTINKLNAKDKNWMVTGQYGVIHAIIK
ncbi:hypothetical protein HCN44_008503 [Aphidius gifuensis]|uniref:Sugar phosphate phosphatase n=1 Tax=Aphidius gifuensis TaxID=684658 RepID=A0A834XRA9_APHGI|nr:damage-control phosphatase ARMT1-like [Aphidius gifuensis]KAF7989829.1 hypothetical protein HCN44_008503 [Aphidius gifuensis]